MGSGNLPLRLSSHWWPDQAMVVRYGNRGSIDTIALGYKTYIELD